jgi:hypothetical protein
MARVAALSGNGHGVAPSWSLPAEEVAIEKSKRMTMHPAPAAKARLKKIGVGTPAVDRYSDLQAEGFPIRRCFPTRLRQCTDDGFRSCLPLRDSSGFAPDSLFDNAVRLTQSLA